MWIKDTIFLIIKLSIVIKPFGKYLFTVFVCLLALATHSQNILLKIVSTELKSEVTKFNYKKKYRDKSTALKEVSNLISSLHYKGFLLASSDSIYSDSTSVTAYISQNKQFRVASLKIGNLNPNLASKLGISEKLYLNKPFKYKEVARSLEKIILHYENSGFPFVTVNLDSIVTGDESLGAVLNVQKNKFFKIDSVKIVGTAKVNKGFMNRYLDVKENMPYNESLISVMSQKLKQLPFITETKPLETRLSDKTNRIILFLDKKNASQFDGIIGFLPDADTKKTIITGDLKLKLMNSIFKNGETFDMEWRRLKTQTQDFNGRIIYPYLFGTPVGTDYSLKIYKRDTTFIDITNNIGLQYYFSGLNNLKVYYKQRNSNLISTSGYDFITNLPDFADIATQSYGLGIHFERLDYRFNPHKGLAISINGQTGNRTINKNPKINSVAYDKLLLRSTQYQFESSIAGYLKIYRNNVQ